MLISHGDDDHPAHVLTDTPDGPASRMAARLGLAPSFINTRCACVRAVDGAIPIPAAI